MTAPRDEVRDRKRLVAILNKIFDPALTTEVGELNAVRIKYHLALSEIARFLYDTPDVDPTVGRAIDYLAACFTDLAIGIVPAIMDAARSRGGKRDSSVVWLFRAEIAASLDAFVLAGENEIDAAAWIAKRHPDLDRLKRRARDALSSSIINWRKHFQSVLVATSTQNRFGSIGWLTANAGQ
jgi:hypothetical protein